MTTGDVLVLAIWAFGFFTASWISYMIKGRRWTKDQQDLWAKLLETYHLVLSDDVDRGFHDRVAALLHYPECWDTMAYPTLYDAVFEMRGPCTTCERKRWILIDSWVDEDGPVHAYECPSCGGETTDASNYCPFCGNRNEEVVD